MDNAKHSKQVVFLPWLRLQQSFSCGTIKFISWNKYSSNSESMYHAKEDLDNIFSAYADDESTPIDVATIIEQEHEGYFEEYTSDFARLSEFITFSALAHRSLFGTTGKYCNSDYYQVMTRKYQPGASNFFSFCSRRRDGISNNIWGASKFAFFRPNHVEQRAYFDVDEILLNSLVNGEVPENIFEAIQYFNLANTDSEAMRTSMEIVQAKSAFEALMKSGTNSKELKSLIHKTISELDSVEISGSETWFRQYQHEQSLIQCWVNEFCRLRDHYAHGSLKKISPIWSDEVHLAFAAILFPRLVKYQLSSIDSNCYKIPPRDLDILKHIECFISADLNLSGSGNEQGFPWKTILSEINMLDVVRVFYTDG